MDKPTDKRTRLAELAKAYNLGREDFFQVHNTVIVTRTGVEKIANSAGIELRYELIHLNQDAHASGNNKYTTTENTCAAVKCIATMVSPDGVTKTAESFGESAPYNTKAPYPLAMAEKRAKARAILQLTEFYSEGVYSEDESDDFKR